jgi:hypothetical protein
MTLVSRRWVLWILAVLTAIAMYLLMYLDKGPLLHMVG